MDLVEDTVWMLSWVATVAGPVCRAFMRKVKSAVGLVKREAGAGAGTGARPWNKVRINSYRVGLN